MKVIIRCCIALGLFYSVAVGAQVPLSVHTEIENGLAAMREGDFSQAEVHFSAVLKVNPDLAEVRADLGLAYYADHQYSKAIRELQLALKLDPTLQPAKMVLPMSLAAANHCTEAEPGLEEVFSSASKAELRRMAGLNLQRCLTQQGRQVDANRITQQLLQKFPDDPDVLYEAGQFYGKLSSGIYRHLMRADPGSARTYQVKGDVADSIGKWKEAIGLYREALKQEPALHEVHLKIAVILLSHSTEPGAWHEALQELRAELQVSPGSAKAEYEIGEAYRSHNHPENAIPALRRSIQSDPTAVPPRISLAKALRQRGERQAALEVLKPAARADPKNPSIHYLLAQIYREIGNTALADRELATFKSLQKDAAISTQASK
jgi:tetratricopeptide (TPR) repeat protein